MEKIQLPIYDNSDDSMQSSQDMASKLHSTATDSIKANSITDFDFIKSKATNINISNWRNYELPPITSDEQTNETEIANDFEMAHLFNQIQTS
ncbi:hypothetical protein TVAG_497290 [Trichomonas vaginalis G3]|uniref:Uncharacterized protein n=1 Tax=Trichomonas vaginalis (strain ATCC PRA-98 / G3) TaxID=412133 RepID=A2EGX1_TRIV3|nr:hypothetical protein TVAGG3_0803500 [Trichomonas vaginalis G3]EAY08105.1 hypothetical protein TVAG_497290 [Trichomonas vaginalis G3]KAI5496680.1 hypothetical protein TVAGG3_0803500 [Trichomonas vaginalis G3]|eukprot:XP_001320328.1 hypothetical protein [Trichomonas vaginalis G3]